MARRNWSDLSDGYRARLARAGIDRTAYESGESLKGARGHRSTPEHPREAERRPEQYKEYRARKAGLGKDISVITVSGVRELKLNAADRRRVAEHWNAVHKYMRGTEDALEPFAGLDVKDQRTKQSVELETNPTAIWIYTHNRQVNIPSIYERVK